MSPITIITYISYIRKLWKLSVRWWTLQKHSVLFHAIFYNNWTDCFRQHIHFYYLRGFKKNIICYWKQLSFTFLYKWWVNLFTVDANFEMGPRWIFFTDGQFLTISRKIACARFAMAEIERGRERGNYLVREKFHREKLGDFFRFCHLFYMKCFRDQNHSSLTKSSPWRKFCLTKTFSKDTLMYVKNL